LKSTAAPTVDPEKLQGDARTALAALSTLLSEQRKDSGAGSGPGFFGGSQANMFDAGVSAYTHLILDATFGWRDTTLVDMVGEFPLLVEHERRMFLTCHFGE
jgi:hypothetical protein